MSLLAEKHLLVGVCGGIAAYKVCDWVRHLRRAGAKVTVVMTEAAARFVSPLTFAALSARPVHTSMFGQDGAHRIPHIELARAADAVIIAPATAHTIARLAHGMADDLLSTVVLACRAPTLVFPAMNSNMFSHPATAANLRRLREYGYTIVSPESGAMACGDEGPGRLPDWRAAEHAIKGAVAPKDFAGRTLVITAGPTHEDIDPVRFLSNRSSGKMGYALAAAASQRGAAVTLVSGPVALAPPPEVETVSVRTAREMQAAVLSRFTGADAVIKAAAVSDFRPSETSGQKIKKTSCGRSLPLRENPDILHELGRRKAGAPDRAPLLIGFAAESQGHIEEGSRKLRDKNLDMIVINDILGARTGFGADTNQVTLVRRDGHRTDLDLMSKEMTAHRVLDAVAELMT